jgi:hypothetical protein
VVGDNSLLTDYVARQYMEYSVNLSKLGLDQAQIFGGDDCQMPFRRVIVKTRASTSFTSELKDFVAPFDFFIAPKAFVETESPIMCDTGSLSHVYVANPIPTSVYQWTTLNGHIVTMPATGPSIYVDTPGVYIVNQYLQAGCSLYASDTITIDRFSYCGTLSNNLFDFTGNKTANLVSLTLKLYQNQYTRSYDIERSTDGVNFEVIQHNVSLSGNGMTTYAYSDNVSRIVASNIYYRVRLLQADSRQLVSNIIRFQLRPVIGSYVSITPNPVRDNMTIHVFSTVTKMGVIHVYDQMGKIIYRGNMPVQKGNNTMTLDILGGKPSGIYQVVVLLEDNVQVQRVIHVK